MKALSKPIKREDSFKNRSKKELDHIKAFKDSMLTVKKLIPNQNLFETSPMTKNLFMKAMCRV